MSRTGFPRVCGIGLPHTGTSTLHTLLLRLGCCYARHNIDRRVDCVAGIDGLHNTVPAPPLPANATRHAPCTPRIVHHAQSYQCLSEYPHCDSNPGPSASLR